MRIALHLRAVGFGCLAVCGGYVFWLLVLAVLIGIGAPHWGMFVLIPLGVLLAALSGFVGASLAPSSPIANGALAGLFGACTLPAILGVIAPTHLKIELLVPLLGIVLMACIGAIVAALIRPRHEL